MTSWGSQIQNGNGKEATPFLRTDDWREPAGWESPNATRATLALDVVVSFQGASSFRFFWHHPRWGLMPENLPPCPSAKSSPAPPDLLCACASERTSLLASSLSPGPDCWCWLPPALRSALGLRLLGGAFLFGPAPPPAESASTDVAQACFLLLYPGVELFPPSPSANGSSLLIWGG